MSHVVLAYICKLLKPWFHFGHLYATVLIEMTNTDHFKAFRLFELAHAESSGRNFQLKDWEKKHLRQCIECRDIVGVFARQFRVVLPGRHVSSANPRFNVGDPVIVIGPGNHNGKSGVVTSVVESKTGDFVYRYYVQFQDGGSDSLFGFELEFSAVSHLEQPTYAKHCDVDV